MHDLVLVALYAGSKTTVENTPHHEVEAELPGRGADAESNVGYAALGTGDGGMREMQFIARR